MPVWFPEFCDKLAALESSEIAELLAELPPDDATLERSDRPKPTKRRKVTLAAALKQAAKTGVPVSAAVVGTDGVTLHFGKTEQATDLNPWDEVLPREPN
jgi:hypothetical protein